jgi:hypothetical protein
MPRVEEAFGRAVLARLHASGRGAARRARPLAQALRSLGALLLSAACAAPGSDVHLAPFFSRFATADQGVEIEAVAGLYRQRSDARDGRFRSATLGPIASLDRTANGWRAHYLVPLGYTSIRPDTTSAYLFPVFVWRSNERADGTRAWSLLALPGVLVRSRADTGTEFGWFPFYGHFHDFLTFDEVRWVLFPLFVRAHRGGKVATDILFPVLGWVRGGGERSQHLWPLFGVVNVEGRRRIYYVLWPFFHYQLRNLDTEKPRTTWMVFPLLGRTTAGDYRATTVLWPFFGWSRGPFEGSWAVDAPWPLVRLQRSPDVRRTRVWPFYSYLKADGLVARSYLWPIVHVRHEGYPEAVRDSVYVVPFWQSWDREVRATGERSSWRKLFPLFQLERHEGWERGSFPTLDPFARNEMVDRHFSWLWKLWEWEQEGALRRERSWGGLWRRERDEGEDRASLAGLWSRRRYEASGRAVRESSLLFGLVRWRVTEDEGFDMLPPAFPGPGWPAERVAPPETPVRDGPPRRPWG